VGKAFRAQAGVQKGAGKALGSVIAAGDFQRAAGLPRYLQTRGCVKQKSFPRHPTIRW